MENVEKEHALQPRLGGGCKGAIMPRRTRPAFSARYLHKHTLQRAQNKRSLGVVIKTERHF
eukprot:360643-Chlamydomonas_euryale.AAC.10